MFEVTQFLLTELPDTTYVLFFRTPDTVHSVVQQMAETYRGRVHLLDDLDSFDGYCSVTLLPVSYPFFTVNDIGKLAGSREQSLVGHFMNSVDCNKNVHECRFFDSIWKAMVGPSESCGRHFCAAAVPREALQDPQLASIDGVCEALHEEPPPASVSSQWHGGS